MRMPVISSCAAVLLAASWAICAGPAQPPPPPPQPNYAPVDRLDYSSEAAARQAWPAMFAQTPVSVVETGGRKVLRLPCPFAGTKIDRASWDLQARLDLTVCQGVQFQFYCADTSSVSSFSCFFRSGGGWYHQSFFPGQGGWQRVEIDKEGARIEGQPDGWGKIDAIRISAWRGQNQDTEFYLADLGLLHADAPIAVVRAEAVSRSDPGEARSAREFTSSMVHMLGDMGLSAVIVSDLDVTAERLKDKKLVILPHNPGLPGPADEELAKFVAGGGKVIAFYVLPGRVGEAIGIRSGQHLRQKQDGDFASIRASDGGLAHMPPVVAQRSWNILAATAVEGTSRVVATWYNQAGQPTGHAAVLASDRGIFMTHVLLPDDLANKRRMLLAMVGHLRPELVAASARRQIERIGRLGPYRDFDQARVQMSAVGDLADAARRKLDQACTLRQGALDLVEEGKAFEAVAQAAAARQALLDAYCLAQKPAQGEHRAFWCHSAFGVQGMTWDQAAGVLADNGFTAVLPNMLWGGVAFYDSHVLPVAPEVKEKGDQIAQCLAACKKHGIACHVWKVNYNLGWRTPKEFKERLRQEGRLQLDPAGKLIDAGWLCPSNPANQKLEIDAMVEVATRYDVDGIHFDYIRYPGNEGCFCDGCRERFEKVLGRKVARWPADLRGDLAGAWNDFRREQITTVVAGVSQAVRKTRPACKISAAVFPNWAVDRDSVGQDWKLWCERGYLDFVCPMDYTDNDAQFEGRVAQQIVWAGKVPVYPGIGLSCWPSLDICRLISQIDITRRHRTGGFTVFNYAPAEAKDILPLCGQGVTRKD